MPQVDQNVHYGSGRSILVLADDAACRADAVDLVTRLGGRARAPAGIEEGLRKLDEMAVDAAVLADIQADTGRSLDHLLDRLNAEAAAGRRTSVVSLPVTLADVALARAPHPGVILLADADESVRALVLGAAMMPAGGSTTLLREGDGAPLQLLQLSEEVGRIARTLAALSGADERRAGLRPSQRAGEVRPPSATVVRALIRARRLREQFFPAAYFADPAWDMMLDLFAARLEERPVAVSSLCIAAAVPPTTALRWMKQLVDDALFVRIADPRDGRRVFIELSTEGAEGMASYFEAVSRTGVLP